ncbi:MAG: hypothetical protein H6642_09070 [Caldilineaceae bacterium]|nr:hypothetical protein [Caldilineaceae bacterium]
MGASSVSTVHVLESTTYLTKIYEENPHELESPPPHFLRNRSRYLYLIAIVLALTTLLAPAPIYSQTDDGNVPDDDPAMQHKGDPAWDVVAAYAQGLNISYEEAQARFDLQDQFGYLIGELEAKDSTYGGAWIEHEPEFGLYLQFSSADGGERLKAYADRYPFIDQVHVMPARYSYKELIAMQGVVDDFRQANSDLIYSTSIGMYEQEMKIFVGAPEPAKAEQLLVSDSVVAAFATAIGERAPERVLDVMRIEYSEPIEDMGYPYPNYYGGGGTGVGDGCTPGLALINAYAGGKKYASSAAHCSTNRTLGGVSLGPTVYLRGRNAPYYSDLRIMDAEANGWNITNRIGCGSSLCEYINGYQYKSQLTGMVIAQRGSSSNFGIAEVVSIDWNGETTFGKFHGFVKGKAPSWWWPGDNPAVCHGDSGGAVFRVTSYPYANGVGIAAIGEVSNPTHEGCYNYIGVVPVDHFPTGIVPLTQ